MSTEARTTHIEIHEDNAGGLWFVPVGEGIAVEMPRSGDALTDCRLYRSEWHPEDTPDAVISGEAVARLTDDPQTRHVATYRPDRDALEVHEPLGYAAREYLGLDR